MKPMGFLGCVCLALALGGCLSLGDTQATRFYVLTPLTDSATALQPAGEAPEAQTRVSVGLVPVDIPRYLDRPQIVTRISANELSLAEFDQWAEPLPDSVTQVLAENLTRLLSTRGIDVLPDPRSNRSTYQVGVTLMRFEHVADSGCVLRARWTLMEERDQSVRVQNAFDVRIPLEASGYDAIAGAMSRALGALSRDIALHLRAVVTHGGTG
ncbi:PqiC family protein [Candidatus Entotheonella palauensis]|uniref:ABC-type transport auxiliary lipoprotein component domain-containing protein n=1 Tax=Candidatus Entotheonella gemina TaxID=1429439 RepID=W4MDA5_9BACT|nr:PqiC family protein [Candidatus Entotheonella palauensis]ETX08180.1 MAG: hypothetical protein ETSY2_06885 [Candidatus Entotheonella gemina]